jgi:hypothetical protein
VANTAKVGYTEPTYLSNTYEAELGGYVIQISSDGKHGLVVAMQDQGISNWYEAKDLLSNPDNHDGDGKKFLDWRLPTKRELNLMSRVYVYYGNAAGLSNARYWSSTEETYNFAYFQMMSDDSEDSDSKGLPLNVRAVRAF